MVFLPVVERELRVATRGRSMYRVRFYAVVALVVVFAWNMASFNENRNPASAGPQLLAIMALGLFIFALFIGAVTTTDCVSREKREGTLGLLFLTDLGGFDVICGKLAATSVNAFYALVAVLPVLGLPLLIGGVTFSAFGQLALALFTTMVLSLAAGIFVSAYSRQERKAMVFAILLLLGVVCLPLLAAWRFFGDVPFVPWGMLMFSAAYAPYHVIFQMMAPVKLPAAPYWFCVAWQWLLAAAFIARASAHVPHAWQESHTVKKPPRRLLPAPLLSRSATARRARWLDHNPFLWLALRGEAGPWRVWMFVASTFMVWLIATFKYGINFMLDEDVLTVFTFVLNALLMVWIAGEGSRRFVEDRANNTFEFLLSTPLTSRQIIEGQWQALVQQFAGPMAALLLWQTFLIIYRYYSHPFNFASRLLEMFFLLSNSVAIAWVAMWFGLTSKGRIQALLRSLAVVLGVPWMLYLVCYLLLDSFSRNMGFHNLPIVVVRVAYSLLLCGLALFRIPPRLSRDLRHLVAER